MSYNEGYYKEKEQKITDQFTERKDRFIKEVMTLAADFQDDVETFKQQYAKIADEVRNSKTSD